MSDVFTIVLACGTGGAREHFPVDGGKPYASKDAAIGAAEKLNVGEESTSVRFYAVFKNGTPCWSPGFEKVP